MKKPSRGRPRLGKDRRERTNINLDPKIKKKAVAHVERLDTSLSLWVEELISRELRTDGEAKR